MTSPRPVMPGGTPSDEMTAMSTPMPGQTTTDRNADAATRAMRTYKAMTAAS